MIYNAKTKRRTRTLFIAVHCSATSDKQDIGAAEINKWHRARGWACIGYHYVIRRNGVIETGRADEVVGAHVQGYNEVSVGVCMVGGVSADDITIAKDNFTKAQWASLKELLLELKVKYPKAVIQGHRDFPDVKKACPSFDVKTWLKGAGL